MDDMPVSRRRNAHQSTCARGTTRDARARLRAQNETGGRFAPLPRWIPSPSSDASYIDAQDAQADSFSLLVATATRFEIGCVISPIIFIIISVERALSAISVSNAVRA